MPLFRKWVTQQRRTALSVALCCEAGSLFAAAADRSDSR
jgi:hypothetical protein